MVQTAVGAGPEKTMMRTREALSRKARLAVAAAALLVLGMVPWGASAEETDAPRRGLLATSLLSDAVVRIAEPVVSLALKPVEIIVVEWIVNPITYQIKNSYENKERDRLETAPALAEVEAPPVEVPTSAEVEKERSSEPDFWGSAAQSIRSIFLIEESVPEDVAESNEGVIVIDENTKVATTSSDSVLRPAEIEGRESDKGGTAIKKNLLVGRYSKQSGRRDQSWMEKFVSLSRTAASLGGMGRRRAEAPGQLSLLKCGTLRGVDGGSSDRHIVSGSEAALVMKLEGFTPSSAVILFGSQKLAGESGLPAPVVSNAVIREALESLDVSLAGTGQGTRCDGIELDVGGLVDTIDMSLDTPHKILRIVNHTNRDGTTFVQRMRFTERYCTGKLFFQALDTASCRLTSVVNATLPDNA